MTVPADRIITNKAGSAPVSTTTDPLSSDPKTITNGRDADRTWPGESIDNSAVATQEEFDSQNQQFETQIQFLPDSYASPAGTAVRTQVKVAVTDSVGGIIFSSEVGSVEVEITGGTATNKRLVKGSSASLVNGSLRVPVVNGEATVEVEADATVGQTVTLGLNNAYNQALVRPRGGAYQLTDTAQVDYS